MFFQHPPCPPKTPMDGLHLGSFASHSEHLRNIRAYEFVGHMLCTWDMGKSNGLFTSGPIVSDGRQTVVWLTPKHQWQLPARDGSCTLFLMIPKSLRNLRWQCMKTYITAKHVDHDTCHAGAATFPKSNVTCSSAVPGEAKVFNLLGLSVKAGV